MHRERVRFCVPSTRSDQSQHSDIHLGVRRTPIIPFSIVIWYATINRSFVPQDRVTNARHVVLLFSVLVIELRTRECHLVPVNVVHDAR